jgi:hypothetical protein
LGYILGDFFANSPDPLGYGFPPPRQTRILHQVFFPIRLGLVQRRPALSENAASAQHQRRKKFLSTKACSQQKMFFFFFISFMDRRRSYVAAGPSEWLGLEDRPLTTSPKFEDSTK